MKPGDCLSSLKKILPTMGTGMSRRQLIKILGASLLAFLFPWKRRRSESEARAEKGSLECLRIISVRPDRPHLVRAGSLTTFVIALTNDTGTWMTVSLAAGALSSGWTVDMSQADRLFQPTGAHSTSMNLALNVGETRYMVVALHAASGLSEGAEGSAVVRAYIRQEMADEVLLRGKVYARSNVYFVAIDGLNRKYLNLSRRGEADYLHRNPLMPNLVQFCKDAAVLSQARSQLPSYTDPNHVSVLTGSWPGTSGAISVKEYYYGPDENGDPVMKKPSHEILRWGASGEEVLSLFDVAKDSALGGDPDAFNALITGKPWLWGYFEDESETVDILASGSRFPPYIDPPTRYVMGDPPSDSNAATDRDGINVSPPEQFHAVHDPYWGALGEDPGNFPDDRWIIESALKIIAAEDPQVFYILAACVDGVGHHVGAANMPGAWDPGQNPNVLWDDINVFTYRADRDPMLDTVYEADVCFGTFRSALKARGTYDDSVLISFADHGMRAYFDQPINQYQIITDAGIPGEAIEFASGRGEFFHLYLSDPAYASPIQQALRNYTVYHPVWGKEIQPFVVLNRQEMGTGIDAVIGRVAASKDPKRAELYSEWYMDHPVQDTSKPRWPDLTCFMIGGYQGVSQRGVNPPVGGHGGIGPVQEIAILIHGPGIQKRVFTNPAYLVDILPTLCTLLGWDIPENVDGRVLGEIFVG